MTETETMGWEGGGRPTVAERQRSRGIIKARQRCRIVATSRDLSNVSLSGSNSAVEHLGTPSLRLFSFLTPGAASASAQAAHGKKCLPDDATPRIETSTASPFVGAH